MNNRKNKIKGFTLIEILIVAGIIAVASVGLYAVANIVSDWRKSSAEVQVLSNVIIDIDNATATTGDYSGLTIAKVKEISNQYNPVLSLASIESPSTNVLHFNYKDINSRICTDFSTKMLSSAKNITAIVNSQSYANDSFKDLVVSCKNDKNEVTIILNRVLSNYTIDNVVASINPPAPAAPDIVIPTFGGPTPLPVVPGFVPSVSPSVPTLPNPGVPAVVQPSPPAPGSVVTPPAVPNPPPSLPPPPTTTTQYCWNGQVKYPSTVCPPQPPPPPPVPVCVMTGFGPPYTVTVISGWVAVGYNSFYQCQGAMGPYSCAPVYREDTRRDPIYECS